MKFSVIIPCYNERRTLAQVVRAVRAGPLESVEIVVVDDGSTDGSAALVKTELAPLIDHAVFHEINRGKGAALRSGFALATGSIFLVQDADLEYSPAEYPALVQPIVDRKADAVFGSRFLGDKPRRFAHFGYVIGNRLLTSLCNFCTGLALTDIETGCKAFRAESLRAIEIEEDGFGFEPEITVKLARANCRIEEVAISYRGRVHAEGKKLTWRDGLSGARAILKYRAR